MNRLTKRENAEVVLAEGDLSRALLRLAAFEDVYEALMRDMAAIPEELRQLKTDGKEKTVRYRELFGQKLMNAHIADLFERYGITTLARQ